VQLLASCPYRYFLARGLRLKPWEEPGRSYSLESNVVGTIFHEVLHDLFVELADKKLLPLDPAGVPKAQARAAKLLEAQLAAAVDAGLIVHPTLLGPIGDRVRADLDEFLEREAAEDGTFVPTLFEEQFDGVTLEIARGRNVVFGGYIDRIDVAKGPKRVRVIDYKTGSYNWQEGEEFQGGRTLQLAIYNLVAAEKFPKHEVTEALYYYATSKGKFRTKACPATKATSDTLRRVLATLDGMVDKGHLPPVADDCRFCDFTDICGPHRERRAQRRQADPRLAAFQAMREIP
jgi:ATP-dependent helicase/nuclease subunit B